MTIKESPIKGVPVIKIYRNQWLATKDKLAIEEPLEIRLAFGAGLNRTVKNISVTMRTPGSDAELATGFLFTEGIIKDKNNLASVEHCFIACAENKENVIQVELHETAAPELKNTERNFYTTSSCGVCGKGSIDAIKSVSAFNPGQNNDFFITAEMMRELPDRLRLYQDIFDVTGGLHACALFNTSGELLLLREDVGRHNALDKLIGAALERNWLPLKNAVLLLSGRASFELVQKAAMAGISIIGAIGAPSSLAVQLAGEFGITLVGFLRQQRFNIYTMEERILLSGNENQD
ncbi:MAG: formate dehydrogenase accessory protein [Mucilaginibacter sp.]|nr:formate dehydrogenase accessory protein [Mucilaginibacter sp.]